MRAEREQLARRFAALRRQDELQNATTRHMIAESIVLLELSRAPLRRHYPVSK